MANKDEKKLAAYALNLWTVSVSQIVEYNDVNIMKQEYDSIMNNLNLENMPKDEALLDVIKEIMDEITNIRIDDGDMKMVEREYQHQMKNAIWSAVPNVGAIFASPDLVSMGLTLATQVGIGYMNYRRNKADNTLVYEKGKWQIEKNRMQHLNALQKQLFETAWRLADAYQFNDEYRLTQKQISDYNKALMEPNIVKRYNNLDAMSSLFDAYPAFWYQIGSTANSIYRSDLYEMDIEIKERYRELAIACFEKYRDLNQFNLLRHDMLTSSWALEYLDLLDLQQENSLTEAKELIKIAEKNSGNALDVLELCAFAYLRIKDNDNAVRLFHYLVNKGYNEAVNTQILSGLYIIRMRDEEPEISRDARFGYKQLPNITEEKYILEIPNEDVELSQWIPEWNKEESFEQYVERKKEEQQAEKEKKEEDKKKARPFYQKRIYLVYKSAHLDIAEFFRSVLDENRIKIDSNLPSPIRCEYKKYKNKREEIESAGDHVILIGDSDEAKAVYKNTNNGRWDYYKLGMRYVTSGNKTVLLTRKLKNEQISDLIELAREMKEYHSIKIPSGVESVKYSFLKEIYEGKFDDTASVFASITATIIGAPILLFGQAVENIENGIQSAKNIAAIKKLELLQYSIAIYKYLESQDALVD